MKILYPAGPAGASECITTFLQNSLNLGVFEKLSRSFRFDPTQARLSSAFHAYHLDQEVLQNAEAVGNARFTQWQYLVFSANSPVTDLGVVEQDGKLVVSHMRCDSELAKSAIHAIRLAEAAEATDGSEYEFRMLCAPSVRFVGAWLHRQNDDVVIPIGNSTTRGLTVHKIYTGKETLDLLKAEHAALHPAAAGHS